MNRHNVKTMAPGGPMLAVLAVLLLAIVPDVAVAHEDAVLSLSLIHI